MTAFRRLLDTLIRRQPVEQRIDPVSETIKLSVMRAKMASDSYQEVVREVLEQTERLKGMRDGRHPNVS